MRESWLLRPPEPEEAAAATAVIQAGFDTYVSFAPPGWQVPDESRHVERVAAEFADPRNVARVADAPDGSGLAGVALLIERDDVETDMYLRYLFVAERYWGTGLAVLLHDRVVAALAGRSASLFTPAGQARSRRFYEREGWTLHRDAWFEERLGMDVVEYRR